MHLKRVIMAGTAAALFSGSVLSVSAAELSAGNYAKALKESGKETLIIDVEAYKAAYSDLAEAFGDNKDAYIEHYLTIGVYEGRTKGVLFDPLAYAEAYGDVKAAFGDDISAIVNHYVTFGTAENRTMGTANGYEDIEAAEKAGSPQVVAQRNIDNVSSASDSGNGYAVNTYGADAGNMQADGSNYENNAVVSGSSVSAAAGSSTTVNSSVNTGKNYHHTTSIYTNDESTLLRVEYYDDNNKLFEYSQVTNYDKDTNSYTENVYQHDNVETPIRTDTYVNGELVSSESH